MPYYYSDPNREPRECPACRGDGVGARINASIPAGRTGNGPGLVELIPDGCRVCDGSGTLVPDKRVDVEVDGYWHPSSQSIRWSTNEECGELKTTARTYQRAWSRFTRWVRKEFPEAKGWSLTNGQ